MSGTCALCLGEFTKAKMSQHLPDCMGSEPGDGGLRLLVEGRRHWMHLLVRRDAMLADLDDFLRRAWLECCGHLSQFTIERVRFSRMPDPQERNMNVALSEVLAPGMRFHYEYDFGSTTELALQMLDEWAAHPARGKVQLLALNNPPNDPCSSCGEPAKIIDLEADPEEALICAACAKRRHLEEMVLPIVNSPRSGVCGYTGPTIRINKKGHVKPLTGRPLPPLRAQAPPRHLRAAAAGSRPPG